MDGPNSVPPARFDDGNPNVEPLNSCQTHHHQLSALTLHAPPSAITSFFRYESSVLPLRVLALGCLERPWTSRSGYKIAEAPPTVLRPLPLSFTFLPQVHNRNFFAHSLCPKGLPIASDHLSNTVPAKIHRRRGVL
jgi:hypothetical protein